MKSCTHIKSGSVNTLAQSSFLFFLEDYGSADLMDYK